MPTHAYQMGPLVINSAISLPYPQTTSLESAASIHLTDKLPAPPTQDHAEEDVVWVGKTAWLFIDNILQGLSLPNRNIFLMRSAAYSQYSAIVMLAIRALLIQLGMVLLYGAAIASEGEATVFVGKSGSGKSTRAAFETTIGGLHLNDDMVPLYTDEHGTICTFQCDRFAALSSSPAPELAPLYATLPPPIATRSDGKSLYLLGRDDAIIYPIQKLIFLNELGTPNHGDIRSTDSLKILLQSLIGSDSIHKVIGVSRLSILARLVHQVVIR